MPVHLLVQHTKEVLAGRAAGQVRIQGKLLDMHARNMAVSDRARCLIALTLFFPMHGGPRLGRDVAAFRPARRLRMRVANVVSLVNNTEAFPDCGVS
jgi:hypothetical protein